jgi:hypothetical protein
MPILPERNKYMNPNSPEVTELMERIRQEARAQLRQNGNAFGEAPRVELPALADPLPPLSLPPAPRLASADPAADWPPAWETLLDMVARARSKITVDTRLPGWLRPLFRNQGGYNGILLEAVERLTEANQQLQEQIEILRVDLQTQRAWQTAWHGAWLKEMAHARESERQWMRAVEPYLSRGVTESDAHRRRADRAESRLAEIEEQSRHARSDLEQLGVRASYHETHAGELDHRLSHLQSQVDEQAGRLAGAIPHVDRLGEQLGVLRKQADSQNAHIAEVHAQVDRLGHSVNQFAGQLGKLDERQAADAGYLKSQLDLLGQLVQRLIEPADVVQPSPDPPASAP